MIQRYTKLKKYYSSGGRSDFQGECALRKSFWKSIIVIHFAKYEFDICLTVHH